MRASGNHEEALRSALLAAIDHDFEAAERALGGDAYDRPDGVSAFFALARIYRARGETGRAIRVHQNLLSRTDLPERDRLLALAELAEDFRRGGFLRRAIASFEEVLVRDPGHAAALRALARLQADVRAFDAARAAARRLAKLERRSAAHDEAMLWVEMAEAAHGEGRTNDARRAVKRALGRDASLVRGYVLLGGLEAELGNARAALAAWRRVAELDRRAGPQVYPRIAASFAALGKPREHESFLRGLLSDQPDDAHARIALARALAARGETGEAAAELRMLVERDPDDLEAQHALGSLLLAAGPQDEALRCYGDLLRRIERLGLLTRETSA